MFRIFTAAEQVANHLREGLFQGQWAATMPGRKRLARELGVDGNTIERALALLESEGLIRSQGAGKCRLITMDGRPLPSQRILIVPYEASDRYEYRVVSEMNLRLSSLGHQVMFAPKSLKQLRHQPRKVREMVESTRVDACVVVSAARPVLEMLARSPVPTFAVFGRFLDLPLSGTGPDSTDAIREAVACLSRLGHKRIVMLANAESMESQARGYHSVFLEELEKQGLPSSSSYNLPHWKGTPESLHQCLRSLFQLTPPTAILFDDRMLHHAILTFLQQHDGAQYRRVACIPADFHPCYQWVHTGVSCIHWDPMAVVRRVVRWVEGVKNGERNISKRLVKSRFIHGGDLDPRGS